MCTICTSEVCRSFTMDIRYIDDQFNTHTEFLELIECAGNAESMTYAFLSVLGPDLLPKLIGGAFDVGRPLHLFDLHPRAREPEFWLLMSRVPVQ